MVFGEIGVSVGWVLPQATKSIKSNVKPVICGNNLLSFIVSSLRPLVGCDI